MGVLLMDTMASQYSAHRKWKSYSQLEKVRSLETAAYRSWKTEKVKYLFVKYWEKVQNVSFSYV